MIGPEPLQGPRPFYYPLITPLDPPRRLLGRGESYRLPQSPANGQEQVAPLMRFLGIWVNRGFQFPAWWSSARLLLFSETVPWAHERARLVCGRALQAYEKVRLAPPMARLVYAMVLRVYEKVRLVCGRVLGGRPALVLHRAVASVPRWSPPGPAPPRSSGRS